MSKLFIAFILLICLAFTGCAQTVNQPTTETKPGIQESVKTIPVEIPITNQIYVRARINNSEPLWFILDTGATWTILDVDKAKELNIKSEGTRILDVGQKNTITTTFARDASLDISGIKVPVPTLAVMPIKLRHAPQIVGLIGSDLFKRFVVEFDYQAKTINLFEPKSYQYTGSGEILPFELIEEIPHIRVNISKGQVESLNTRLLLDTGASQTIVLYAPFVEKNNLLESTEGTTKHSAGGLGGGSTVLRTRAKTVKIGKQGFENAMVYFSQSKGASTYRDGIIGNGFLNRFKMIVDYSRYQVILEPNDKIVVPTDFDAFLFEIIPEGKTFKIGEVFQASTAGQAGLKSGDLLLAVDSKPISNLSLTDITRLFTWDGLERILMVKRGDETLEIKLKTSSIF